MHRDGSCSFVSDELIRQADKASVETIKQAFSTLILDEGKPRDVLNGIRECFTPCVALFLNSGAILRSQIDQIGMEGTVRIVEKGRGPVAIQQFIAQWLYENPDVMAKIVSDERWDGLF